MACPPFYNVGAIWVGGFTHWRGISNRCILQRYQIVRNYIFTEDREIMVTLYKIHKRVQSFLVESFSAVPNKLFPSSKVIPFLIFPSLTFKISPLASVLLCSDVFLFLSQASKLFLKKQTVLLLRPKNEEF